jgi:hypothetical protein
MVYKEGPLCSWGSAFILESAELLLACLINLLPKSFGALSVSVWTLLQHNSKTDMVVHACNPSTQEAEVGGSWVQVWAGLPSEILSQKKRKKRKGREVRMKKKGEKERERERERERKATIIMASRWYKGPEFKSQFQKKKILKDDRTKQWNDWELQIFHQSKDNKLN